VCFVLSRLGFIVDAMSWGDYDAQLSERLNAEGVDLLKHADQHPVRLSLKAGSGPEATYYLVVLNEYNGQFGFFVHHRLRKDDSSSSTPDVFEYLSTLDPNSVAYVTVSGTTFAARPPAPLTYTSIRAANWTRPAELGPAVVVSTTSVDTSTFKRVDEITEAQCCGWTWHSASATVTVEMRNAVALATLALVGIFIV
jgi:hypothetical protein